MDLFRRRFDIPVPEDAVSKLAFYRPSEHSRRCGICKSGGERLADIYRSSSEADHDQSAGSRSVQ